MSDLYLNKNFEVELNGEGDLKTVSGIERVKQSVAVHVTDAMHDRVGEVQNTEQFLRLAVKRALRTHSLIEDVQNVEIQDTGGGKYTVMIDFGLSSFSFEVSE